MFSIDGLNIIQYDFGDHADDFFVYAHCEVSRTGDAGGEAFSVTVMSPRRLLNSDSDEVLLGRGLIVMKEYDERLIQNAIMPLLRDLDSWEEVTQAIDRYFDWI